MSPTVPVHSGVRWLPWSPGAFAQARAARRPVLLSVSAGWSEGCREMDRMTYGDPRVAAEIHDAVVPVRVDADERPDVADRYDLGGLPSTAFLTPEGELLGGGTFISADRLRETLPRVAAAVSRVARAAPPPASPLPAGSTDTASLVAAVMTTFDAVHAGFGGAPKFPHPAPVRLALQLHEESGDPGMAERAARTLDAMGWGPLFDDESGGFFRYCGRGDWSAPRREQLLAGNAALLDLYVEAGERTANERWFARAVDVVRFIETRLRRRDGAWRAAAGLDASRVFTDANAAAVSALLRAARVFGDDALGGRALDALEHVLLASYRPGEGVAHCAAGARGLLTDQVAMAGATLDAWEATGNVVYRMMAEELVHYALRTHWDAEDGGFFDRGPALFADEPDRGAAGLKPFVLNCEAATVLGRLAEATSDPALSRRAADCLDTIAPSAAALGPLAAHYLIARRAIRR